MTMELGLYTDSVGAIGYETALDLAVEIGASALEIAAGGISAAPHLDLNLLLSDRTARQRWRAEQEARGLRLAALNCSAWLLHPVRGAANRAIVERTLSLAGLLGVSKVVTMSGLPGDGPGSTTTNWSWSTWPADAVSLRERQWDEAIGVWEGLVGRARLEGVTQIALELHPWELVYNVPTLRRLQAAVGQEVGANLDPSHLFWQLMDPVAVIDALGTSVQHVHLKDTAIDPANVALNGVLDHTDEPAERAWSFRAMGRGHDAGVWSGIFDALRRAGYDDALAIENEDPFAGPEESVRFAARFARAILQGSVTSAKTG
jgi:sugar phosphate isomerase/epimerase